MHLAKTSTLKHNFTEVQKSKRLVAKEWTLPRFLKHFNMSLVTRGSGQTENCVAEP